MNGRSFWFALVVCATTGAGFAQDVSSRPGDPGEPRRSAQSSLEGSLENSLQSSLGLILGSLDALYPAFYPARYPVPYSTPTGTAEIMPRARTENGVYSGFTVGMADTWQSGLAYMFVTSPSGSFPIRQNPGVRVSYDDSRLWATSLPSFKGLQPSATVGFGTNEWLNGTEDKGIYLQLGIRPGYELKLPGGHPVVASLPVTVGLRSDYYESSGGGSSGFGYLDIGFAVSTPLSLAPERSGSWGVTASVNFLFLGDGQEALNGGDDLEVIGSITFGFDF